MAYNFHPAWGEGSAAIIPQLQYWDQANTANANANIGRRTAYDQQDIANRQNYWQAQRAIEQEDAQRQAQAESIARAQAEEAQNRAARAYQFQIAQDFKNKELQASIAAERARAIPKAVEAIPPVSPMDFVSELNAHVADIRAKTDPAKFNHDAIAGLIAKLPPEIQPSVFYQPADFKFHFAKPASVGMGNVRQAEAYNFAPTSGTGTTPAPQPQASISAFVPTSNQGGGYFPTPAQATAPPAAAPFREGQRILNKRDGRFYIVRGGVPVPE